MDPIIRLPSNPKAEVAMNALLAANTQNHRLRDGIETVKTALGDHLSAEGALAFDQLLTGLQAQGRLTSGEMRPHRDYLQQQATLRAAYQKAMRQQGVTTAAKTVFVGVMAYLFGSEAPTILGALGDFPTLSYVLEKGGHAVGLWSPVAALALGWAEDSKGREFGHHRTLDIDIGKFEQQLAQAEAKSKA